ncbi:MAG: hypothetical protein M3P95_05150, partial [Actinomycetota bacterium]|nr:hypothetical protein [Actinomycetota bacterium]
MTSEDERRAQLRRLVEEDGWKLLSDGALLRAPHLDLQLRITEQHAGKRRRTGIEPARTRSSPSPVLK